MKQIKIDFHVHSDASPDGRHSIPALAQSAHERGFDAICICDHDRVSVRAPYDECGVTVLPGCECSTDCGHILALFFDRDFAYERKQGDPLPHAQEVIAHIHAHGGIAVLAHPYERGGRADDTLPTDIDAIECANARAQFRYSSANRMAAELAARLGLPALGGSDAHDRHSVGDAYTLLTADLQDDLADAIRAGKTEAVLARPTPRVRKGLSQFVKAKRSGKIKKILRATAYLGYCCALDLFKETMIGSR